MWSGCRRSSSIGGPRCALSWTRPAGDLNPEDFKDLHRNTVDELNRRVRELHGIEEPAKADA